jgi:hypothetical protein
VPLVDKKFLLFVVGLFDWLRVVHAGAGSVDNLDVLVELKQAYVVEHLRPFAGAY